MQAKSLPVLVLLLPFALAACDSSQPSYNASNAPPPPPPAAQPAVAPPQAAVPAEPAPAQPPAQATPRPVAAAGARGRDEIMHKAVARGIHLPPAEKIGIGGCDDYVARYRACLADESGVVIPIQRKYQLAHALSRQMRKWGVDIKNGKNGEVAQACTQASNEARETLGKLGCKTI